MIELKKVGQTQDYVYDISLDGSVVNALGMNIVSNTDGFNFKIADILRYTDEHPYISNGGGRNTVKGQKYTGVDADVAEFEDTYMHSAFNGGINKNGLGIDEYCDSTINFSRKNYADLMPDGKIKLVGNSIKSKKMPIYIEKFLTVAIDLLLHGKGKEFLEYYYDYIEKIYNLKIPLKEIATVGKIKVSIDAYKKSCKQLTAAGTKKSRQAWYELAIKDNLSVNMGDTIYYINTGKTKKESDVKRETIYYLPLPNGEKCYHIIEGSDYKRDRRGNPISLTKEINKEFIKYRKEYLAQHNLKTIPKDFMKEGEYARMMYSNIQEEDRVIFNCVRLPNEIVEDEDDHFCDENFEYNSAKYIDMFNSRIRPLLVCFDRSIRLTIDEKGKEVDNILIDNPKDRKTFTEQESRLVPGQPNKPTDQDTYEALMSMEDKEIKFWMSVDREPPYAKECGINWPQVKEDYLERIRQLSSKEIQEELALYESIIDSLSKTDVEALINDGTLPDKLLKFVDEDMDTGDFISKRHNVRIGTIFDIIDKDFNVECDED